VSAGTPTVSAKHGVLRDRDATPARPTTWSAHRAARNGARCDGRAGRLSASYRRACRCGFSGSGCSTSRGGSPSGLGVGRMSGVRGVWERHHIRCRGQGTEIDWTHASGACAQPARTLGQRSSQRTSLWCAMPISRPPRVLVRSRFPRVPRPPPTTRCRHRTRQLLRPR
jgi:hypothetical protein